ncbi:MAG: hypothetical protein Q9212_003116 [Teloschistes hypoglaucus]
MQLGLIASHGGRTKEATTAFVPVQFSSMHLSNDIAGDTCTVIARGERRGMRAAYLDLQMIRPNGETLLNIDALRCISYSTEAKPVDKTFSSPFTRSPFVPSSKENVEKSPRWAIVNKLANFVILSIYESFGKLQDAPLPAGDVGYFFDWIKRKELVGQASDVMEVKIAKLLHDNIADVLYERRTGMDVIIGEDLLTPFYQSGLLMTGIYPQLSHVLARIAHSSPDLRILEIGGGTGGATRIAMKALNGPNNVKAYRDYPFTDISPGFLSSVRESMADFRDMNFSVFDTEVDPMKQGYEQAYDIVIACQVLHATSNMHQTLSNCRKLLKPGGRLDLVETSRNFSLPCVVLGTFTGYWADSRVIALLDEKQVLFNASEQNSKVSQHLTHGALVSGLLRVLQKNPASQYMSIDIDADNFEVGSTKDLVRCIVDHEFALHQDIAEEGSPKDRGFSWHDGCMWVGRHVPDTGFHSQYGLDSQIIKTAVLPINTERAVGTVTAVGVGVSELNIGDRVYGLGRGQFGSYTRVPAAFASKLRPNDDMAQMATMPMAYITAAHASDHIAYLRKGQSGAKDLGLASIRLAKAKGADVFAMVETPEQASFLVDKVAMPASHVISSPSSKALRQAAQITRNGGFDAILTTIQGELLHSSFQVLAPLCRLIDMGRVNLQSAPVMSSQLLQKNAAYCSVGPFTILNSDPALGEELMQTIDDYHHKGLIGPIERATVLDVDLTFDKLSASQWNESLSAKVEGTKNLHEATLSIHASGLLRHDHLDLVRVCIRDPGRIHRGQQLPGRLCTIPPTDGLIHLDHLLQLGRRNHKRRHRRHHPRSIRAQQGAHARRIAILDPPRAQQQQAPNSGPVKRKEPLSAVNLHTYLHPAAMAAEPPEATAAASETAPPSPATTAPRWYDDSRVSLTMHAFTDAQRAHSTRADGSPDEEAPTPKNKTQSPVSAANFPAVVRTRSRTDTPSFVHKKPSRTFVAGMLFIRRQRHRSRRNRSRSWGVDNFDSGGVTELVLAGAGDGDQYVG